MHSIRRTALTAALALTVAGAAAAPAMATEAPSRDRASIEQIAGDELRPAKTAKQKREIRKHLKSTSKKGQARAAKGAKKQSRWYTPLGCLYFTDATLCGSYTGFDVSYQIYWYDGSVSLGYMTAGYWDTLVYYFG